MLELCRLGIDNKRRREFPCRRFIRLLGGEATATEELVDNIGAQKNQYWYPYREAVAAVKLFSSALYNLRHIQDALPRYRLLEIPGSFASDTENAVDKLRSALFSAMEIVLEQSKRSGIERDRRSLNYHPCPDDHIDVHLAADKHVRHVHSAGETVVYLSTVFLNLSEDTNVKTLFEKRDPRNFSYCVPSAVNEKKLRVAESKFHNLQSHYDTYIFETDIESQNRNLPILRGHISIVYHLLQIATSLSHYYERHMSTLRRQVGGEERFPLTHDRLLSVLFSYLLAYGRQYTERATDLCRSMIKGYSEQREITVPIPTYRGFHVRPSTLIAKIVGHYGSSVRMFLNSHEYNAGITLDLFRANEEINAIKRRCVADTLDGMADSEQRAAQLGDDLVRELQILFLDLVNSGHIILYDSRLSFTDLEPYEDESLTDLACRYVRHYMSISKVDVHSDIHVVFRGDSRALIDIKTLAENGYGEDHYGNNVVLPPELSYLRT